MKFYFDNHALNLSHVPEIAEIREFDQFKHYYNIGDADFVYSKEYTEFGVYLIETSKLTHQWTGDTSSDHSFNLIKEIPNHVIKAVQNNRLRIVIISIVEGDNFVKEDCDGFQYLTDNIKKRNLPPFSVLIMTGNIKSSEEYKKWCIDNNQQPIIEFIGASEGPTSIPDKTDIVSVLNACINNSLSYNSLNRAPRQHRCEHLFFLADKKILADGLVSGVNVLGFSPKFLKVEMQKWNNVLQDHYPQYIDFNTETLRNINPANEINITIYCNSLLSIVTETYFEESGLFFSEKIFKPILVGSPQLTLTQPYANQYMKYKFNIDLNFPGIDTSFDAIENHQERFMVFHNALLSWVNTKKKRKIKLVKSWKEQLTENMRIAKTLNFKKIIINDIIKSTTQYFLSDLN